MKKGIILEIKKSIVIVMTPEGEFIRLRNQSNEYAVGQEITFSPTVAGFQWQNLFQLPLVNKKTISVFAMAAIALLFLLIPQKDLGTVHAYVSLDNQSSLELAVNNDLEVIDIIAYNEEGEQILNKLSNWKNKDLETVANEIIYTSKEQNYINEESSLVIGTVLLHEETNSKVNSVIDDIKQELTNEEVPVESVTATQEDREVASELGSTAGLYINKKQAQTAKENPVVQPSEQKSKPDKEQSESKKEQQNQGNSGQNGKSDQNGKGNSNNNENKKNNHSITDSQGNQNNNSKNNNGNNKKGNPSANNGQNNNNGNSSDKDNKGNNKENKQNNKKDNPTKNNGNENKSGNNGNGKDNNSNNNGENSNKWKN